CLFCLLSTYAGAQEVTQTAVTETGKKVILKPDGTWVYKIDASATPTSSSNVDLSSLTDYDRFKNMSVVSVPLDVLKESSSPLDLILVKAVAEYRGAVPNNISEVYLQLDYMNYKSYTRIADSDSAFLIIDGQSFEIPYQYPSGKSWLVLKLPLELGLRKALYSASAAELKISRRVITLSETQLKDFRRIMDAIVPLTAEVRPNQTSTKVRELSNLLEFTSDIPRFIDVPVRASGLIKISTYYNYGYGKAQATHHAFEIVDASRGLVYVYMERGTKSEQLRTQLLKAGINGARGTFTFVVRGEKYNERDGGMAELIDYGPPK
ncbi:MAG TPA: hypothetical protein PLP07_10450, partial [Pyrinomonadaceae bacterium]|nr:hypothetical protein [Pyrinomonadaceae bacterium]